jgi:hypothetical protein
MIRRGLRAAPVELAIKGEVILSGMLTKPDRSLWLPLAKLLGLTVMFFFLVASAPAVAQTPFQASGQALIDPGAPMAGVPEAAYSLSDLRKSYGAGLRYLPPSQPFRIEYGRPIDRQHDDSSGQWEFTMGSMF